MQETWCHDQKLPPVIERKTACVWIVQFRTYTYMHWNSLLLSGVLLGRQGHMILSELPSLPQHTWLGLLVWLDELFTF